MFDGPGAIRFATDVPDPQLEGPDEVVVEVLAAGLCGSDLHPYLGREGARAGVVPGHEVVGRVAAIGSAVTVAGVGDRVLVPFTTSCGRCEACGRGLSSRCETAQLFGWGDPDPDGRVLHGGQAQLLRVPSAEGTLVRLPPAISDLSGVLLADNLPTGWYAAVRGGVGPGSRVAVVGLGSVGLCAVVASLALGAASVTGVDPVASRRQRAADLGAAVAAPDGVQRIEAVDVTIDAAGPADAQRLAAQLVRPGGVVSVIAVQTAERFAIDPVTAYDKNLTITAGRAPVRSLLEELLPMVLAGRLVVPEAEVVTHSGLPLTEGPAMYRRFADHEEGLVKVVFTPG
ncbi:alcohol dehydrogenase family protein [soil metagenome]